MKDVPIIINGQTVVFEVPEETTQEQLVNAVVEGVKVIGGRPKRR